MNNISSTEHQIPAIRDLDDLISELHKVFESDKVDVDYVKALMSSYKSNPADWKKYAKFDDHRYTRNLVDSGNGKFNLIALCWGEGQGSSVHDHSDAHCFMKILDGQLTETTYAWPAPVPSDPESSKEGSSVDETSREMITTGSECFGTNSVLYINDSLGLHRVENPSHCDKSVSLHLYSPPFDRCQVFDERTGRRSTAKVTFWSKYGKRDTTILNELNECASVVSESKETEENRSR